jgi:sortase A
VHERQIVNAGAAVIRQDDDEKQLVLVTCYPFDTIVPGGPLRYVVTAGLEDAE